MKKLLVLLGLLLASPSFAADNSVIVTPGVGVTMRSKDVGAGVESMIHILGDTTGNPIYGTAGTANANILTVQGIASMTPFLATLGAETTKVIGTVRNVGNVGGVIDAIGQNVAAPANWWQSGCQFNTAPTTITTGNGSPCQVDSAGNMLVNVKADATAAALLSAVQAATPAGSAIIGKVGIDQTTPGTTNAVNTTNWPTAVDTNSGNKSASTPRFVIATDQPNLTTPLNVALAANQSVNIAQVGGVATPVGSGVQATAPRTTLATDSPGIIALGQAAKSASVPTAIASDQLGGAAVAASFPHVLTSQYPVNSVTTAPTPITGNATGTTGAVVGTLAAAVSVTTYICGFAVSALGTANTVGPITVAGLVGSSQVFQASTLATGVAQQITQTFNPCIPASAVNTAITITTTAAAGGTAVDVNSWGYRL
jgi:hypothetical protein